MMKLKVLNNRVFQLQDSVAQATYVASPEIGRSLHQLEGKTFYQKYFLLQSISVGGTSSSQSNGTAYRLSKFYEQ